MKDKLDKLDKLLYRVEEEMESNAYELRKLSEMLEPLLDQVEGLKNLDIKLSLKAGRLRADANELKQLIKSAERFETNYKEDPKELFNYCPSCGSKRVYPLYGDTTFFCGACSEPFTIDEINYS